MVAGTTIGAGMLGMPLITSKAGFLPAVGVTFAVWAFMLITGLLLLQVCIQLPGMNNILSISQYFWGKTGKKGIGGLFAFLYYCLLVAYFAAGAMLISTFCSCSFYTSLLIFTVFFGTIVFLGPKWIDRVNSSFTILMFIAYGLLVTLGSYAVDPKCLFNTTSTSALLATPVLFSAFGFHNIIPSLVNYTGGQKNVLKWSIILGTTIALVIFLVWQWLIIGAIPKEILLETLNDGLPVTQALQAVTGSPHLFYIGQFFAFFALTTSLLGVCFSMIDFLSGVFTSKKVNRFFLTLMTFLPPLGCVLWNPQLFDKALCLAGGVGEAILNGFVPIAFFLILQKKMNIKMSLMSKVLFFCLLSFCLLVLLIEVKELCGH